MKLKILLKTEQTNTFNSAFFTFTWFSYFRFGALKEGI